MGTPTKLHAWIVDWLSKSRLSTDFELISLAGDGSTREFFRLKTQNGQFIVLFDPSWTLSKDYPAHQSFLKTSNILVPEFLVSDPKSGCLVMEDLGDELLQMRIVKNPVEKMGWLEKAVSLLASLHGETFPVRPDLPVSTRRFDEKKYFEEFQFTFEHLNNKLLKMPVARASDLENVRGFCKELEGISPEVFSHRDYHCRNLLLHHEKLVMIDFQDARLGPPHYDLASLLYDAYVPITDPERNQLLALYRKEIAAFTVNDAINWESFDENLKRVALQRTLKAAGSFASFYTRYQKNTHLPYLVPALESALRLQGGYSFFPIEKWIELSKELAVK